MSLSPFRWELPTCPTLFKGHDMVMTLSHMDHAKMGSKESKPMSSCLGGVTMHHLARCNHGGKRWSFVRGHFHKNSEWCNKTHEQTSQKNKWFWSTNRNIQQIQVLLVMVPSEKVRWTGRRRGPPPPKSDTPGNPLNPIESSEIQRWTGMCINQILQIYWTKHKYNSEVKKEHVQNKQTQLWLGESTFSIIPLSLSWRPNCIKPPELITSIKIHHTPKSHMNSWALMSQEIQYVEITWRAALTLSIALDRSRTFFFQPRLWEVKSWGMIDQEPPLKKVTQSVGDCFHPFACRIKHEQHIYKTMNSITWMNHKCV